ncbi:MAG: hypothetical protein Q8O83_01640 [bacterium]|nr:hypothetical protein [bacterium]
MEENLYIVSILAVPRNKDDESRDITIHILSFISCSEEEADTIANEHIGVSFSAVSWKVEYDLLEISLDDILEDIQSYEDSVQAFAIGLVLLNPDGAGMRYHVSSHLICAYSKESAEKLALAYAHEHFPFFKDHIAKVEEIPPNIRFCTTTSKIH